ncbi:MAG: serine/threonine protein kinase [Phycisphaerales bacterium]|nr:serine/threonine protein kinase [Phycisphaerales bacterium]MCB9864287.1 serine/threonine protein kinase [Phycisphaerales bacterium]
MSSSLHDRAGQIFLEAINKSEKLRSQFVEAACGGDVVLRDEVESLLRAHEDSLPILDEPPDAAGGAPDVHDDDRFVGTQFGSFRILTKVASGGMGVVYRAEQEHPRRIVAIKLMRRGLSGRSAVRRFQFEVQALGLLQHAGIAQVFEAGVEIREGVSIPYFAMELVEGGRSITSFANERQLTTKERLALVAQVCDAVHSGHQKGIIHRDLKPDNILVDERGQPKVIDFGTARATDADMHSTIQHSEVGRLVGTLPYMSPEQLSGDSRQVDTRTDVYALGVVLYELLSGQLPIAAPWESMLDAVVAIRESPPRKLGSINTALRGDIETIAAKAIDKDKSRRYQSAAEFAADIRRYLSDEPISARPPTAVYQLRMFARRNRGLVRGAAIGAAALLVAAVISTQQAFIAMNARDLAQAEETRARHQAYLAGIAAAAAALENHDVPLARRSLERTPESLRGWEWRYLNSRLDLSKLVILDDDRLHRNFIRFLDNDTIGAWDAGADAWIRWEAHSGAPLADLHANALVLPNRSRSAQLTIRDDTISVDQIDRGFQPVLRIGDLGMAEAPTIHLSDNGNWLSVNSLSKAMLLNLETNERFEIAISVWPVGIAPSAVSDNGQLALGTGFKGKPAIWNSANGSLRPLDNAPAAGLDIAFDPASQHVAAVLSDATVRLWDADSAELIATGHGHTNGATVIRFSPDGKLIATAGRDRTLRLWTPDTLEPLAVLHGHADAIADLEFDETGTQIVTVGAESDRTIRVWDVASHGNPTVLRGHNGYVYPVAVSPDGNTIASGAWDNEIRLWDANRFMAGKRLIGHTSYLTHLEFSPDGRLLLSLGADKTLRVWDVVRGVEIQSHAYDGSGVGPTWHPDGVHVYLPGIGTEKTEWWNTESGEVVERPCAALAEVAHVPVSPNGRFAVVRKEGRYEVVRLGKSQPVTLFSVGRIFEFSPVTTTSRFAAIEPENPCIVDVWDLGTNSHIGTLRGHSGRSVWDIAFSPDGSRIVTAGDDQVIRIWDATTMDEIVQLRGHTSYVWSLVFRPDGTQLISGSGDGTLRVWDTLRLSERLAASE